MKNFSRIMYNAFIVLCVFTFAFFLFVNKFSVEDYSFDSKTILEWNRSWDITLPNGETYRADLPHKAKVPANSAFTMSKTLPGRIRDFNCIMIKGNRQDITVTIGGKKRVIYSDKNLRKVGNSSPSVVLMVPLYNTDGAKVIEITSQTSTVNSGEMDEVYIGSQQSIFLNLFKSHAAVIAVAIFVFILGLIFMLGNLILRFVFNQRTNLGMLFWFSILVATWSFTQSPIRQVFYGDIALFENLGYSCLMLLPIPVILMINGIQKDRYSWMHMFWIVAFVINYGAENILQLHTRFDFYEMQYITQYMLIIVMAELLITLIVDVIRLHSTEIVCAFIGFLGLAIGLFAEFYYRTSNLSGKAGYGAILGMLFFIIIYSSQTIYNVIKDEQRKTNALNASKAKSQFLATMSHEIRTPINAVLGMNEMILRDAKDDDVREYAGNIAKAGKSLLALINDILDFSKIESGKMDIINVDYNLKSLLRDLIIMIEDRVSSKGLNLILDIDEELPSVFYGDEIRIKQIITNLLTNAVKYTEKGDITFSVKKNKIEDNSILIDFSVKDTGIGVKSEDLAKLSESFVRVDETRNRNIEGTGLGLSITIQLLELMGSKLNIKSTWGEGSEFSFTLSQPIIDMTPIGKITDATRPEVKAITTGFTAKEACVLVVDDNAMNLQVVKGLLKPTKIKIDIAESGAKALRLCEFNYYDIIFMDHMMPEMDGITALHKLRENVNYASAESTVIALTANAVSGAMEMYLSEGFAGYITKPIDLKELQDCILANLPKEIIQWEYAKASSDTVSEINEVNPEGPLNNSFIDGETAMKYCADDLEAYYEILSIYYEEGIKSRRKADEMNCQLFGVETVEDFTILAHSLKSTSKTIGALKLSDLALKLEMAGRNNDMEYIDHNVSHCAAEYSKVLGAIKAYLIDRNIIKEEITDNNEPENDSLIISELLKAKEALVDFEYDDAIDIIDELLKANGYNHE